MQQQIKSKLHDMLERLPAHKRDAFRGKPIYVIEKSAIEMARRSDIKACVNALLEEGAARLPYPDMIIEYENMAFSEPARTFIRFAEEGSGKWRVDFALMASRGVILSVQDIVVVHNETDTRVEMPPAQGRIDEQASEDMGKIIGSMSVVALVLTSLRGIDREVIEPHRLNRARVKSGKEPIPSHTVIRIGSYYDVSGREVRAWAAGSRGHMPMHIRAGYHRWQRYGPGLEQSKRIFIESVIVNFDPAAGKKADGLRPKIVRA